MVSESLSWRSTGGTGAWMSASSSASLPLLAFWRQRGARLPQHSRLRRSLLAYRLRQSYAAATRRDFELLLTGLDPAIELHRATVFLDVSGTFHGHAGYREVWRRVLESFEDIRLDPEEMLVFGDRALATVRLSRHGAGSGTPMNQPLYQLFTLRRGLVVRQDNFQDDFQDRAEALEAVGLAE